MIKRLFPHPWLSLVLAIIWLLLVNDVSPGQVLLGALLGWLLSLKIGERLWLRPMELRRPDLVAQLAGRVLYDIVHANVEVAALVLGPMRRMQPAFIQVPLDLEHEMALTALISIVSLSPGTLCAELSNDRRVLLIHVLNLRDEAQLVDTIKSRYEAPLKEIFVCLPS
ncbi:Na+/H+ antiporter subunit E [Cupriavidus sp. DL-D2]|uniref:Na+/H+ antiporter subunit E n=1 Tax=Cupriavidus sp. DL-D2 TaxID=3144974 RepID=UPI003212E93D